MPADCAEAIQEIGADLLHTPPQQREEKQNLLEQWGYAQRAVKILINLKTLELDRDITNLIHCVFWFMLVHSADMPEPAEKRSRRRPPRPRQTKGWLG